MSSQKAQETIDKCFSSEGYERAPASKQPIYVSNGGLFWKAIADPASAPKQEQSTASTREHLLPTQRKLILSRTTTALTYLAFLLVLAYLYSSMPKNLQVVGLEPSFKYRNAGRIALAEFGAKKSAGKSEALHSRKKYFLCAFSRVKNEQSSLAQWLEYHRLMGFDQFFIADDCSHDRTWEVMSIYQKEGLLTGVKPPSCPEDRQVNQLKLLKHMFYMAQPKCQYLILFDSDEYITRQDDLYQDGNLRDYLQLTSPTYMRFFGQAMCAENLILKPRGLIIAAHVHGSIAPNSHLPLPKTLAIHDLPVEWSFPHWPNKISDKYADLRKLLTTNHPTPAELRKVKLGDEEATTFTSPFFMNHYSVKSLSEYLSGRAARTTSPSGGRNFWAGNPMSKFKKYSSAPFNKTAMAQDFTREMVPKVEAALNKTKMKYPEQWFFF